MDFLLGKYADAKVSRMEKSELLAFEQLMEIPDPLLAGALVDGVGKFDDKTQALIDQIRQFHNILG